MRETIDQEALVRMVGIDHESASADVRSALALPSDAQEEVLALTRAKLGASGLVLLSTCNRVELWASFDRVSAPRSENDSECAPLPGDALFEALCDMFMVSPDDYARYFTSRSGVDAAEHLFDVACGLKSAIVAEDQIVSQVKQAIAYAREVGIADSVLEVLFRQAVTAAKQVKSGVRFTRAYATAVDQAVARLKANGCDLGAATCMVIGNGEYGRLAATTLAACGANVLVTVRQYTHGSVDVPRGCTGIPYDERYDHLDECAVVMSATTSQNYTLEREKFEAARSSDSTLYFIDLAIPHDIDPQIAQVPGCTLYDIDCFSTEAGDENEAAVREARRLLKSGEDEFWDWVARRDALSHTKSPSTVFFPLFVDLSEKRAVFIGGGTIALRRIRTLLPFVGEIVVCAPSFSPEIEQFAEDGLVTLMRERYRESMLDAADIVFACTNSSEVNDEVWAACKQRGTLVNVCSDRNKCDFYFPGIAQRGNVVVGVSAGGKDHRRVRQLRGRIDDLLVEEGLP